MVKVNTESDMDEGLIENEDVSKLDNDLDEYRISRKYKFLPFGCLILIGGFFNNTFQAFIKQQFMDSMNIDSGQYNLFVLIPPLPNIILPIFSGQLYDNIGLRKGLFCFSFMMVIGMGLCFLSTYNQNFFLMVLGKTIHQIGNEMLCIGQSAMVSAWFDSQTLAFAFTWASLAAKLSGSSSGLIFPQLYNINDDLQIPLLVSVSTCLFSFCCTIAVCLMDKKADDFNGKVHVAKPFSLNTAQFTKFKPIFFVYVAQGAFLYGSFYAFESYLHSILVEKFGIDKTTAGTMTSIPFWMAFTAPIFGFLADKYGKRIIGLFGTASFAIISVTVMLLLPNQVSEIIVYIPLVAFGLFLSMMAAYLFPVFPLLVKPSQVRLAFGFGYAAKNAGLSAFGFIGGEILGEHDENYDSFLIFFIGIFIVSCLIQLYGFFADQKDGGNINASKPKMQKKTILAISRSGSFIA